MVGVCEKGQNLAFYVGQDATTNGWAYYGCNGYVFHGGGSKQYGQKLKQGDIITVELDIDSGTVSFAKNGSSFGIAYSSGLEGLELFPAVSLYDIGDCVSILDSKKRLKRGNVWITKYRRIWTQSNMSSPISQSCSDV